jgi:hypothetical protein
VGRGLHGGAELLHYRSGRLKVTHPTGAQVLRTDAEIGRRLERDADDGTRRARGQRDSNTGASSIYSLDDLGLDRHDAVTYRRIGEIRPERLDRDAADGSRRTKNDGLSRSEGVSLANTYSLADIGVNRPDAVTFRRLALDGVIRERRSAQALATMLAPARAPGRPHQGEKGVINPFSWGSTNAAPLTQRIARDRPEILARMQRGEFRSVRAAARAIRAVVRARHRAPAVPVRRSAGAARPCSGSAL